MADTPPQAPASPPTVTDNRPVPRGVLPRGAQTWIMAGIAVGMLAIMLLVGRSDPPVRTTSAPAAAQSPSTDRVRDYQERLRAMEAQALREAQAASVTPAPAMMGFQDAASQATVQVMNRFLNRLPTVTVREGHRVKVYLTSDLELPPYESAETQRGRAR